RPSVCSDPLGAYLIESARSYRSSRRTAYSTRGSIRAYARECHNAESPDLVYQTSPMESAVPPGDNGRDQIVWPANRKRCCDIDRPGLGIVLSFPPQSAEVLE